MFYSTVLPHFSVAHIKRQRGTRPTLIIMAGIGGERDRRSQLWQEDRLVEVFPQQFAITWTEPQGRKIKKIAW